jgi:hypothetical protein
MLGVSRVAARSEGGMLSAMPEQNSKPSRRGTDVRRRRHQVGVRLLPEELEKLKALAERSGVSPAEVLRRALFTAGAGPATPTPHG